MIKSDLLPFILMMSHRGDRQSWWRRERKKKPPLKLRDYAYGQDYPSTESTGNNNHQRNSRVGDLLVDAGSEIAAATNDLHARCTVGEDSTNGVSQNLHGATNTVDATTVNGVCSRSDSTPISDVVHSQSGGGDKINNKITIVSDVKYCGAGRGRGRGRGLGSLNVADGVGLGGLGRARDRVDVSENIGRGRSRGIIGFIDTVIGPVPVDFNHAIGCHRFISSNATAPETNVIDRCNDENRVLDFEDFALNDTDSNSNSEKNNTVIIILALTVENASASVVAPEKGPATDIGSAETMSPVTCDEVSEIIFVSYLSIRY